VKKFDDMFSRFNRMPDGRWDGQSGDSMVLACVASRCKKTDKPVLESVQASLNVTFTWQAATVGQDFSVSTQQYINWGPNNNN